MLQMLRITSPHPKYIDTDSNQSALLGSTVAGPKRTMLVVPGTAVLPELFRC